MSTIRLRYAAITVAFAFVFLLVFIINGCNPKPTEPDYSSSISGSPPGIGAPPDNGLPPNTGSYPNISGSWVGSGWWDDSGYDLNATIAQNGGTFSGSWAWEGNHWAMRPSFQESFSGKITQSGQIDIVVYSGGVITATFSAQTGTDTSGGLVISGGATYAGEGYGSDAFWISRQ